MFVCLNCDHEFSPRSSNAEQRRCSVCHSRDIILRSEYERIEFAVVEYMKNTVFGIVPIWDIVRTLKVREGMRLTDSFTVALMGKLYRDINSKLAEVNGNIQKLYQKMLEERTRTKRGEL